MASKMNEKAFSFLSNISLNPKAAAPPTQIGSKSSSSSSSSSKSSSKSRKSLSSEASTQQQQQQPPPPPQQQQIFLTNYTSKPITNVKDTSSSSRDVSGGGTTGRSNSVSTKQTWIYSIASTIYRSINASVGTTVALNCKQKNVLLKRGDQFYFSMIIPTKIDRIVALATVSQEPTADQNGTKIILTFDKLFQEPIPRDFFSSSQQLSDIVQSKSTFTNISDSQLPVFTNLLNSYFVRKKPIKEAQNFLSGISLGPSITTNNNNNQPNDNVNANTQNNNNNNNNQLNAIAESSMVSSNIPLAQQQIPSQQQSQQALQQQQQQQQSQQSSQQIISQPYRKRNTIEDFNASYNVSIPQRIYFTTTSGYPISVFSMIRGETRKPAGDTLMSVLSKESNFFKLKETSYAHLLPSNYISPTSDIDAGASNMIKYDPLFLDNSELKTGKHRTVMNLTGYKISIFPYIKKGAIKEELNEQFRQKHEWVQTGVTLYKIRKLKRQLKKVALIADIEMSTVALSYVLIEKLIIRNQMTKANFKLYAAGCLLLAAKFNDPKALESLVPLIENLEKKFSITKKELLSNEFHIYSQVSFGLFVDYHDVLPHYARLRSEILNDSNYDQSFFGSVPGTFNRPAAGGSSGLNAYSIPSNTNGNVNKGGYVFPPFSG
ncbi:hypothetical protein PPL_09644 [Heterostelium album PN500]|uniref:Cyclin-like domain-containing protein n=1 Tax=Heterostelium pallidum (strain ATCC 26659 / Pp 5 / PN500) TaxID=670386 RepID=D3BNX3_HETP5|nr:hypothetical protein PPL_09644 [Heterostelium album PN500]EFA76892.1 hypothetical protein PPL_09644 [Heterostelium album PN500]|eukprot:XP_020429024.1 hypothetical protein PPL_09644 [Heterostelium album PN500]